MGTGGNGWERVNYQGAIAMTKKSFSGADLFGMATSPTKRTNDRPEQAVFLERVRGAGGVAFMARDLRDVLRELENNQRKQNHG